jgi:hypothetical protein
VLRRRDVLRSDVVRPTQLDADTQRRLGDEVFAVHRAVFAGIDRPAFDAYVFGADNPNRWLLVVRDPAGAAVGYCAMHFRDLEVEGRPVRVLRGAGGLLPEWRGGARLSGFVGRRVAHAYATRGERAVYFAGAMTSPSSYRQVSQVLQMEYPRPGVPTPPEFAARVHAIADALGMPLSRDGDPSIRRVGWTSRFSPAALARITEGTEPYARDFARRNPRYLEGEGIAFAIPITAGLIARGVARLIHRQVTSQGAARPA